MTPDGDRLSSLRLLPLLLFALACDRGRTSAGSVEGPPPPVGTSSPSGGTGSVPRLPWLHVEGNRIKNPEGDTVILRGVALMDLAVTDRWYGGAKTMIDRLTHPNDTQGNSPGWYPKVLRLAVYPEDGEVSTPLPFKPGSDELYTKLLRPIVDYCRERGVYVIIDWHYIATTTRHVDSTREFWAYIAPKFAQDSHVLFELYNEPINYNGDWETVRGHMQGWYDVVRQSAPDNLVLVGTPNWSQVIAPTAANPVQGTNIAYVAHMYPYHFSVQDLRDQITAAALVHPVFVTEWGFNEHASTDILQGTITSYGTPFKQFIEETGASWTAWCASYDWEPPIFSDGAFKLGVGEGWMGGFVKDWLYERRDSDLP